MGKLMNVDFHRKLLLGVRESMDKELDDRILKLWEGLYRVTATLEDLKNGLHLHEGINRTSDDRKPDQNTDK